MKFASKLIHMKFASKLIHGGQVHRLCHTQVSTMFNFTQSDETLKGSAKALNCLTLESCAYNVCCCSYTSTISASNARSLGDSMIKALVLK